jgi:peptidoglycan DL-endopeptidase CwlO
MSSTILSPRPPASGNPFRRTRRRIRKRMLALALTPIALLVVVVLATVAMLSGGLRGGGGGGFGFLRFDPNSSAPIVLGNANPLVSGMDQEQLHDSVKIIAAGMSIVLPGSAGGAAVVGAAPSGTAGAVALPARAWVIALATAQQESGLRNLDHGDRDSLGLFQQRPSQGWGTPAQIMNPAYAATKFYEHLVQVPNWQTIPLTDAAQAVQRSAFPNAYAKWEPMAQALVEALVQALPGTGTITDTNIRTAVEFAKQQLGKPYVWGATGPGAFDCSGLMLRAWQAAGVTLPRTSREQYYAGSYLPVNTAQVGDLIFYAYDIGDPSTIHHVAMYLGDGTIIEAQQTGVPVHIRPFRFDEGELMPFAVRVTPKR